MTTLHEIARECFEKVKWDPAKYERVYKLVSEQLDIEQELKEQITQSLLDWNIRDVMDEVIRRQRAKCWSDGRSAAPAPSATAVRGVAGMREHFLETYALRICNKKFLDATNKDLGTEIDWYQNFVSGNMLRLQFYRMVVVGLKKSTDVVRNVYSMKRLESMLETAKRRASRAVGKEVV